MAKLILISHVLCPYVQRAVISLTEKKVPFERIDVDLANKPSLSPVRLWPESWPQLAWPPGQV